MGEMDEEGQVLSLGENPRTWEGGWSTPCTTKAKTGCIWRECNHWVKWRKIFARSCLPVQNITSLPSRMPMVWQLCTFLHLLAMPWSPFSPSAFTWIQASHSLILPPVATCPFQPTEMALNKNSHIAKDNVCSCLFSRGSLGIWNSTLSWFSSNDSQSSAQSPHLYWDSLNSLLLSLRTFSLGVNHIHGFNMSLQHCSTWLCR